MRPNFKPPHKKKYFHTKRKIDNNDIFAIKKKIEKIKKSKIKNLSKDEFK
jgi:hypothetical protein